MSHPPSKDYLSFFTDWIQKLEDALRESLPSIETKAFSSACTTVQQTNATRLAAIDAWSKISDDDDEHKKQAQAVVDAAEKAEQTALDTAKAIATCSLLPDVSKSLLTDDYDDTQLVLYTVLSTATPKGLADWCNQQGSEKATELLDTLQNDIALLRAFLAAGGARNGQYGPAISLYHQLTQQQEQKNADTCPVLHRLAMACALELASPLPLFNEKGTVDPIQRYIHYQQAYLLGELDAHFCYLNVWELRQVVNSDATQEELGWGRHSLWAYRPDIALWPQDPHWQYCEIVKTDVPYKDPDFYKNFRSYDQILSGGGKCGPRAWYGRFICKAFGIPTWGVRQPGHAAMARWVPDSTTSNSGSWEVNLGAGFPWCWWEDQGGIDFLLETQARSACKSLEVFAMQVLRMQWVSGLFKENVESLRRNGVPDAQAPWYSLAMMQRLVLAEYKKNQDVDQKDTTEEFECCQDARVRSIQQYKLEQTKRLEFATVTPSGTIIIPATTCCEPTETTKEIAFLPCHSGGQQLFVKINGSPMYCLSEVTTDESYHLSIKVSTAHRSEEPISVCVDDTEYTINMPYTTGLWAETEPILVECKKGSTMKICRPKQPFGFSMKELKLIPVSANCSASDAP